jgi:hypothetical protein
VTRSLSIAGVLTTLVLAGCAAPRPGPDILAPTEEQTKLRAYQTRTFDVAERQVAMRAVLGVLQDLGFIVERANEPLGLISASRFAEPNFSDVVAVTVTIRSVGEGQAMIRVNAIHNNRPVVEPEPYQRFFAALERSLLLTRG